MGPTLDLTLSAQAPSAFEEPVWHFTIPCHMLKGANPQEVEAVETRAGWRYGAVGRPTFTGLKGFSPRPIRVIHIKAYQAR